MTSNSFKKGFIMMVLKQRFLNDGTKGLKRFLNDEIKKVYKGSLIMVPKKSHNNHIETTLKDSTMMVLKGLERFLNDGTKNVPQ